MKESLRTFGTIFFIIVVIILAWVIGHSMGIDYATQEARDTIESLKTEIENLERVKDIPPYVDPDIEQAELIRQLLDFLSEADKIDLQIEGEVEKGSSISLYIEFNND